MINCPPLETLRRVFDGTLPDDLIRAIDDHLDECLRCRETLESMSCFPEIEHLLALGEFCTAQDSNDVNEPPDPPQ